MNYKEIEYKYWAKELSKEDFSKRIEAVFSKHPEAKFPEVIYVVSCDDYYIRNSKDEKDFVRFRKGGGRYELTLKRKVKKNVVRKEINLNVSNNEDSAIVEFLILSGYKKAFQVYKEAWIWCFDDCDVSYYTLSDGRSVVELEAVNYSSVKQGVETINKWEKALGLSDLTREQRSLYEIFTEEGASLC
jgi:adenylate cyclase class IV